MYAKVEELGPRRFAPVLKVRGEGRVELGTYESARHAAVAYDVARLCLIAEKRPGTDLRLDEGTHHPPEAYLCDQLFKDLLANRTSFADVCEALRSGALADQFLCASPDRQTRRAGSHPADEPCAASSQGRKPAAPADVEEPPRAAESQLSGHGGGASPQQAAATEPRQHPQQGQPPQLASPEDARRARRKPMRWVEWPLRGGGQYVSCISERALKSNMSLPSLMKRELFQTSEDAAQIEAHDLQPGSSLRWLWEVRDYVNERGQRSSTYISNLGSFFRHHGAEAGDVLVVVASAPGLVRATVWKGGSVDAQRFKASLEQQGSKREGAAGDAGAGKRGRKRQAEGPAAQEGAAKAARNAAAATGGGQRGCQPAAPATDAGRPRAAGHFSGASPAAAPPPSQQPSAPAPPQLQARLLSGELPRAAAAGGEPSGAQEELQQLSPTGQVVQSPFRNQLLHPLPSPSEEQRGEQPVPPPPAGGQRQLEQAAAASPQRPDARDGECGGAADADRAAPHSPARVSCASPGDPGARSAAAAAQLAAPAAAAGQAESGSELPDALAIVDDDNAVFRAMACLLKLVAGSGHVPPALVSRFRRSFGGVEPAGRRWYIYDSLQQLYSGGDWAEIRHWLQGE